MLSPRLWLSSTISGGVRPLDYLPQVRIYNDVIVEGWELYDAQRNFITGSGYMRGERREETNRIVEICPRNTKTDPRSLKIFKEKKYIWIGKIHIHFGHFLLSSTSRMWIINEKSNKEFIYVGVCDDDFFERESTLREFMFSIGITSDNFLNIKIPCFFSEIYVPDPTFVESGSGNFEWGNFMDFASRKIRGTFEIEASSSPVYITKHRLSSGVRTLVGEEDLCDHLEKRGFTIFSPEQHSLKEQVVFWQKHPTYISFRGSALHASAFTTGKNIISLDSHTDAQENQYISDILCKNRGLYINCSEFMSDCLPLPGFGSASKISHVEKFSEILCNIVDILHSDRNPSIQKKTTERLPTKLGYIPSVDPLGIMVESFVRHAQICEADAGADDAVIVKLDFPVFVTEIRLFLSHCKENTIIKFVGRSVASTINEHPISDILSHQTEEIIEGEYKCFRIAFPRPQYGSKILISIYNGTANLIKNVEAFGVEDEFGLRFCLGGQIEESFIDALFS